MLLQKRVTPNVNVRLVDMGKDLDGLDEALRASEGNSFCRPRLRFGLVWSYE